MMVNDAVNYKKRQAEENRRGWWVELAMNAGRGEGLGWVKEWVAWWRCGGAGGCTSRGNGCEWAGRGGEGGRWVH